MYSTIHFTVTFHCPCCKKNFRYSDNWWSVKPRTDNTHKFFVFSAKLNGWSHNISGEMATTQSLFRLNIPWSIMARYDRKNANIPLGKKGYAPDLTNSYIHIVFNSCYAIIMMYHTVCPTHCAHGLWSVKLTYFPLVQLDQHWYKNFHSWKCAWKCRLWNGSHFVQEEIN